MNHPIMLLDRDNKSKLRPASFSYFSKLLREKNKFELKKCHSYNRYNLHYKGII